MIRFDDGSTSDSDRQATPTYTESRGKVGIIWFAGQDWWYHNRAHSDFQLMLAAAADRTVLLVNSLGLRVPRPGRSTKPWRRIARKIASTAKYIRRPVPSLPGYYVMTPVILPFYGSEIGRRISAALVRFQVEVAAVAIGLTERAVFVTIPTAWRVVRTMSRRVLIFNRGDRHSAFPEADGAWIASLEQELLDHSDHVLYVSHELMDADGKSDKGIFLDHGVDLERFSLEPALPIPKDMRDIASPRVGFFGGFDDYVIDFDLLEKTARQLSDAQFILIGDATCSMERLTALPNVHWLGYRPYSDIPAYGQHFDVALMPWLNNEWIRFANPIKLKEYLALGLPIVSTSFPEARYYRDRIAVASTHEEFVGLVRAALANPGDKQGRSRSVQSFSWASRAKILTDLIDRRGIR